VVDPAVHLKYIDRKNTKAKGKKGKRKEVLTTNPQQPSENGM
jgi:hypothetical protein